MKILLLSTALLVLRFGDLAVPCDCIFYLLSCLHWEHPREYYRWEERWSMLTSMTMNIIEHIYSKISIVSMTQDNLQAVRAFSTSVTSWSWRRPYLFSLDYKAFWSNIADAVSSLRRPSRIGCVPVKDFSSHHLASMYSNGCIRFKLSIVNKPNGALNWRAY